MRCIPIILLLVSIAAAAVAEPAAPDAPIARWVLQLGDPDPAVRQRATDELLGVGAEARPALVEAARLSDPEIRTRARQLLLKLPWYLPDDPIEIRRTLENYGNHEANGRKSIVRTLEGLGTDPAVISRTMARLFIEEPSEAVQWAMIRRLRQANDPAIKKRLRELDPAGRSAPVLAMCGVAWIERDMERARGLLEQAVDATVARPPISRENTSEANEAEFVFETLRRLYVATQRYDEAVHVLRRRAPVDRRPGRRDGPPDVVRDVFAMHARYGPLKGFASDVVNFLPLMGSPELVYCFGQAIERRLGRWAGVTIYWGAWAMSMGSATDRYRVAEFLLDQNWDDLAEAELVAMLRLEEARGEPKALLDCNAYFRLGRIAAQREDDYGVAENYRQGLEVLDRIGGGLDGRPREAIEADMIWRYIRVARAKEDLGGLGERLDRLMHLSSMPQTSSVLGLVALDAVPVLKQLERTADAKTLFERAYAVAKRRLDADPTSPESMNNVAWLCARCEERLDEAMQLADAARKASPENGAYWDTAAEAYYRAGKREEAIRLEMRAMELRPGDAFMKKQLERFRKGEPARGAEPL